MARIYKEHDRVGAYTVLREISRGMMAVSYVARDSAGQTVFFKQYKSPSVRVPWYKDYIKYQGELKRRIETTACRTFCYRFLDVFEHDRCFFQVFEFLDRSNSMQEVLEKSRASPGHVSAEQRLIMAKVLMAGMNALHDAGIVHSDLKPDNVMLIRDAGIVAGYRLRIIDMDFSLLAGQRAPWHGDRGYFGTPGYLSPEHLRGEVPQQASDVFSLGLMLHELLGGRHPYRHDDEEHYRAAALAHRARPAELVGTLAALPNAEQVRDTIHRCLHPDFRRRPTALEVNHVLNNRTPAARPADPADAAPGRPAPGRGKLVLRSEGGVEKTFNVGLSVGKALMRTFGDDAMFFADEQFVLERGGDGSWSVVPRPDAPNETMLNGKKITARTALCSGDVLGVGREAKGIVKMPLVVRIE
jgi:serine/threonine protein kinase